MPRSKVENEAVKDKQRSNIISAARKVFSIKGSRATISDIALEAGISQGLIYRYFSSKEELLFHIMHDLIDRPVLPREFTSDMAGDPLERIQVMISGIIAARKREPYLYQFMFHALSDEKTPEEIRKKVMSQGLKAQEVVYDLIVAGQKLGEIAGDDPSVLVAAIFGCIEGIWRRMGYLDQEESGGPLPDSEIILRMLRP